ncbi:MAG: type II toxin-antitoxin system VapC family toxin [Acidobacteria bacterium]|nr:MAG: type II toxin-antitoxin system VapC family toxin [Acidobacteriota bacterium]
MSTAIDSSVLWSIFKGEDDARSWMDLLVTTRRESNLVVCDIVFAEVAPLFRTVAELTATLETLGIGYDPIEPETAFLAGEIFKRYRREGGPRSHMIPDFLVGAHAANQAACLAADDRGYLRRYFPRLRLLAPPD